MTIEVCVIRNTDSEGVQCSISSLQSNTTILVVLFCGLQHFSSKFCGSLSSLKTMKFNLPRNFYVYEVQLKYLDMI